VWQVELHQHLEGLVLGLIVLEATGGDQTLAARTLMEQGYPTVVVNPRQVRNFAKMSLITKIIATAEGSREQRN
jgi:transposase